MKFKIIIVSITILFSTIFNAQAEVITDGIKKKSHDQFEIHYMGNVEAGYVFPWDGFMHDSSGMVMLTTTHGVVVTPWLYVGGGIGVCMAFDHDALGFVSPIYGDLRFTYPNRHWRPFADLKIGTQSGNWFVNPSLGIKYAIKDTFGIYLSAGTLTYFTYGSVGLSLNLGFDF